MNRYLLTLGARMPLIRKELGLTQHAMADLVGVSRPTIVKLDKDPQVMSPVIAQALFTGIAYRIAKQRRAIDGFHVPAGHEMPSAAELVLQFGEDSGLGKAKVRELVIMMHGVDPSKLTDWNVLDVLALRHRICTELDRQEAALLAMFQVSAFDVLEFGDAMHAGADLTPELVMEGVL